MSRPQVVLSFADIGELRSGRAVRVNALLQAMGEESVLIQPRPAHPRVRTETVPFDLGRRMRGINWGIFNFHVPGNRGRVRRILRRLDPSVVVMTSIWELPAVARLRGVPVLFDSQNVDAVYMAQRYGEDHWFTRLVARAEGRTLARADHVFVCSEADAEGYLRRYRVAERKLTVVPNGVNCARFDEAGVPDSIDPGVASRLAGKTVLFFMGKLDYAPNRQALEWMRDVLLPELERRAPGRFGLLITGGPVPNAPMHASMVFAGLVPDIRPYLARAEICLAPLFVGSGTRLKILETLAAGKPVVATPVAIEGIPAQSGQEAMIRPPEAFADAILELADQPAQAEAMARAGRAFVRARFDWSAIQAGWTRELDRFR